MIIEKPCNVVIYAYMSDGRNPVHFIHRANMQKTGEGNPWQNWCRIKEKYKTHYLIYFVLQKEKKRNELKFQNYNISFELDHNYFSVLSMIETLDLKNRNNSPLST